MTDWSGSVGPLDVRDQFEMPDDRAYLNCAFMGPLPSVAVEAGRRALEAKGQPWTVGVNDFFEPVARLRQLVARLLDGDPDGVALAPSVSYGIATAAANLRVEAGQAILVLDEQFPSNLYAWQDLAARHGAEVTTVHRSDDSTAALLDAIDERTGIVAVESCHWTDGGALDLVAVGKRCREAQAALVVDVTQSLGAVPFPHDEIQPDVVVGALYKWLLGPYASSFMWVAPHLREGRPIELNWITRAGSEDFSGLVDYTDEFQPGARRYDSGEVSSHVNVAVALEALDLVTTWGAARIAAHAERLTDELADRASALGLGVPPAGSRSPHLVGLRLPADGPEPSAIGTALAEAGVHVSIRGSSVRVSAHAFNTPDDIDRLVTAMAAAIGR